MSTTTALREKNSSSESLRSEWAIFPSLLILFMQANVIEFHTSTLWLNLLTLVQHLIVFRIAYWEKGKNQNQRYDTSNKPFHKSMPSFTVLWFGEYPNSGFIAFGLGFRRFFCSWKRTPFVTEKNARVMRAPECDPVDPFTFSRMTNKNTCTYTCSTCWSAWKQYLSRGKPPVPEILRPLGRWEDHNMQILLCQSI